MLSQACKYGIRGVLYIAEKATSEKKVGVSEIAESLGVPRHFLAKILQKLSKAGLATSVKGPHGGFYMTEENLDRTLADVVRTIDGEDIFSSCILGLPVCSSKNPCPLHFHAFAYREGLVFQLEHQTIRNLAKQIELENLSI